MPRGVESPDALMRNCNIRGPRAIGVAGPQGVKFKPLTTESPRAIGEQHAETDAEGVPNIERALNATFPSGRK